MNAALQAELEAASNGLLSLSESEAPFEYVELAGATAADLAPARFAAAVGAPAGTRLTGVRVLRVGAVQMRCDLVGVSDAGAVAGLATTAIET